MPIPESKLREICAYLEREQCSRTQVAKEFGVRKDALLYATKKYGITLPKRLTARELLQRDFTDETIQSVKVSELCKKYDLPNTSIKNALVALGWKALAGCIPQCYTTPSVCQTIIDDVMAHGGTVVDAIRRQSIRANPATVRRYAKQNDIDLRMYRHRAKRFGLWEVLPSKVHRCYTADERVQALCHGCGTIHTVLITNLRCGKSTCCINCSRKRRASRPVTCLQTGEVFKSVKHLSTTVEGMPHYQTLRYRLQKGEVAHGNLTYAYSSEC